VTRDAARIADDALAAAAKLHERMRANAGPAVVAAQTITEALRAGGKLLVFGNGGSAADAQHFATELVARFLRDRAAMPAVSLSADATVLTSIANDFGFDRVFARQVEGIGRAGDIACAISTSGRSPNVLRGIEAARARGLATMALTGRDGGPLGGLVDLHLNVPGDSTPRIQEVHRTLIHAICELVEGDV
jgi:D-sedoheptulose 7-phosphate isomerase